MTTSEAHHLLACLIWPEQQLYEKLRPVVLFNESAVERARETGAAERTLQRKAETFTRAQTLSGIEGTCVFAYYRA